MVDHEKQLPLIPNSDQIDAIKPLNCRKCEERDVEIQASISDVSFSCVVKSQRRWSDKIYKTELTKTRYNNQVFGKYRVDPQRAELTLIVESTWSKLGLKGVLNKRK